MATDNDVILALTRSAEALLKRSLTASERDSLIRAFNAEQGTKYQKAIRAVGKIASLTEGQIAVKAAASDDTDRAVKDLEKVMQDWNK